MIHQHLSYPYDPAIGDARTDLAPPIRDNLTGSLIRILVCIFRAISGTRISGS